MALRPGAIFKLLSCFVGCPQLRELPSLVLAAFVWLLIRMVSEAQALRGVDVLKAGPLVLAFVQALQTLG